MTSVPDRGVGAEGVPDFVGCLVRRGVVWSRLEQEYRVLCVLGEAGRQDRSRGPGSDDYVVVSFGHVFLRSG